MSSNCGHLLAKASRGPVGSQGCAPRHPTKSRCHCPLECLQDHGTSHSAYTCRGQICPRPDADPRPAADFALGAMSEGRPGPDRTLGVDLALLTKWHMVKRTDPQAMLILKYFFPCATRQITRPLKDNWQGIPLHKSGECVLHAHKGGCKRGSAHDSDSVLVLSDIAHSPGPAELTSGSAVGSPVHSQPCLGEWEEVAPEQGEWLAVVAPRTCTRLSPWTRCTEHVLATAGAGLLVPPRVLARDAMPA